MTKAAEDKSSPCVFCSIAENVAETDLIVHQGALSFVTLNKYPYSNGHLLLVPRRHVPKLAECTSDELIELIQLTQRAEAALDEAYSPHGLNIGINLGQSAGAGVVGHLHIHIVPRWTGDTNFMTTTAETRVVPEEPKQTVSRLRPIFERLHP